MISFKTLNKKLIVILSITLSILLLPAVVYASDLDKSSSDALPYLAPDLDAANAYSTAVKIAENSGTRDVTHTIDDLYSLIISMRTYVNSNYQMRTYDAAVLSAIQDLNGYGTAYNTHSMLMDIWMRIGGNSVLGNSYNLTDMIADLSDTINDGLIVSDGNETYYLAEMVAGIYGQYATPRSIPDLYNKLASIETYVDSIDTYVQNSNSYLYSIDDAIQRLADIYASQDVVAAKQAQQQYEDESIADFTGSGTGAATTGNKNDIKSISSTVKSGLNTGGSASNALSVFTYSGDNWDWFTLTTQRNLDTSFILPNAEIVYYSGKVDISSSDQYIPLSNTIPKNQRYSIYIVYDSPIPRTSQYYWIDMNYNTGQIGSLSTGGSEYINNSVNSSSYANVNQFRIRDGKDTSPFIYIYKPIQTRSPGITDFLSQHDNEYYNILLEEHK